MNHDAVQIKQLAPTAKEWAYVEEVLPVLEAMVTATDLLEGGGGQRGHRGVMRADHLERVYVGLLSRLRHH